MPRQNKKRRIEDDSEAISAEELFSYLPNREISQTEVPIFVNNFNEIQVKYYKHNSYIIL